MPGFDVPITFQRGSLHIKPIQRLVYSLIQEMGTTGIYLIRNLVNLKVYIGSAVDLVKRRSQHISDLRRGNHTNPHLQLAWNKYGESSFEFMILLQCDTDRLLYFEQRAIDIYTERQARKKAFIRN